MVPRLFVNSVLAPGTTVELEAAQAHYLLHVLRLGVGDRLVLFNGRDGAWRAQIEHTARQRCAVAAVELIRPQRAEPDIWLCFAPLKRARIDFLVEKASELGVSRLQPVFTAHTMVERVNVARLRANAIEAAEQSERLSVPEICEPVELARLLDGWPRTRHLILCDETGGGQPIADALAGLSQELQAAPWAILIGPEGGFARPEIDSIAGLPRVTKVGLGPRILRADTAALAALSICQALVGDWREATPPRWPDYATSR